MEGKRASGSPFSDRLLASYANPLPHLEEIPRINTPYWRASDSDNTQMLGNLVLVDTPGPNEDGVLHLDAVVLDQLRESSVVLIVLDYTALDNQTAAEIRRAVAEVIEARGRENLYVLVNKIDQRREKSMTPPQVRQFVAGQLKLVNSGHEDRIFEVSAVQAFCFLNFMQELDRQPGVPLPELKAAQALAREIYQVDPEEELRDATCEKLVRKANSLWEKAGFSPFLERAIEELMRGAAPKAIISALNRCQQRLTNLGEDVALRRKSIGHAAGVLQTEIDELEAALKKLKEHRRKLQEKVEGTKKSFRRNIKNRLSDIEERTKVNIKETLEALNRPETSEIEFNSEDAAKRFVNEAYGYQRRILSELLQAAAEETESLLERERAKVTALLREGTQPIIAEARQRLNRAFKMDLSWPTFAPLDQSDEWVKPRRYSLETRTRTEQGYDIVRKRAWWKLWLGYTEVKIPRSPKDVKYYTFSIPALVKGINLSIKDTLLGIEQSTNRYLDEDFNRLIEDFFGDLDDYLRNYQDSLTQALEDKRLGQTEQEELISRLENIAPLADELKEGVAYYLKSARSVRE